ncbi:hypothetical protein C8R43DRAFT_949287 [Mycena crocata]|nr:hypothetical protein C8R43DRAFT_949287 [Mycena crocata]
MATTCSGLETLLAYGDTQFILRFFRYWEPSSIFILGRLSYRLLNVVRFYQSTVWDVSEFLTKWFAHPDSALSFLKMAPAVFCGPGVLQFFDRRGRDASRLDVCVGFEGFVDAGRFLTAEGYIFRADPASTTREFEMVALMEAAIVPERRLKVDGDRSLTQDEHGSRAFRFIKIGRRSPLLIVVLHLVSTFLRRKSFIACQERLPSIDPTIHSEGRWLRSYAADFGPFEVIGATVKVDVAVETGRRWIGDSRCWTIPCSSKGLALDPPPVVSGPAFDVLDWRCNVTRHGTYLRIGEPFVWSSWTRFRLGEGFDEMA